MKKKHKAYRHITAENISISILQNHTIPKHSFVDHPLQSISKQCLGTGNIPVSRFLLGVIFTLIQYCMRKKSSGYALTEYLYLNGSR